MLKIALSALLSLGAVLGLSAQECITAPAPVFYSEASPYVPATVVVTSAPAPAFGGGILERLNAPLIPGVATVPGLPTPSVLGLVAPRLSFLANFLQAGGFSAPNAFQPLVGIAFPRLAVALPVLQGQITTPEQFAMSGLGVVSPRLATGISILQARPAGGVFGGGLGCRLRCR
ncbi:MAG: hypothetical protein ACRC8S_01615 [Fimbriiglobus sp.]